MPTIEKSVLLRKESESSLQLSTSTLQRIAAFLMALGPGSGGGFYTAMSGFYIEKFHDPSFFIFMLLCYCTPGPIVSLLQQQFDALFDEKFSTHVTYSFRVIVMQLILGGVVVTWMCCPTYHGLVLTIGCCLGFVCYSIISSSLQMVAATEPTHIVNAKLGLQVGGVVPIVVFACTGFKPSSSHEDLQLALAWVVGITVLAACVLGYFHRTSSLFTKAYERLSYDLTPSDLSTPEDAMEAEALLSDRPFERQQTPTASLDPAAAKDGVPSWVRYWQVCHGVVMGIGFCLLSLAGCFGDAALAQTLSLLKLLMDFLGRTISCGIPFAPCFEDGPWHKVMVLNVLSVLALGGVCLAKLLGNDVSQVVFLTSWCLLFAVGVFTASLVDVTTGSYVKVRDRKAVARTNQMILVSCVLIGLIVSKGISSTLCHKSSLSLPSHR